MGETTLEAMLGFSSLMSQIGVTAFALMFTAIQIRWLIPTARQTRVSATGDRNDDRTTDRDIIWSKSRLGKLAASTALLELLTITLVATAFSADPEGWAWRAVAVASALTGIAATAMYVKEHRSRIEAGYLPTPADRFQNGASWLPFVSYAVLLLSSAFSYQCPSWAEGGCAAFPAWVQMLGTWDAWLRGVLVWLLLSGLVEVYVTLSPHLLEAEPSDFHRPQLLHPPDSEDSDVKSVLSR